MPKLSKQRTVMKRLTRTRSGQSTKRQRTVIRQAESVSRKQSSENDKLAALRARIHLGDPKDRSQTEGWQWALQHGFTHINRLAEKDAVTILNHLGITPEEDEYSDGQEEMMRLRYPWKWLEKYARKQGSSLSGRNFSYCNIISKLWLLL
jgi:hypothetical protein